MAPHSVTMMKMKTFIVKKMMKRRKWRKEFRKWNSFGNRHTIKVIKEFSKKIIQSVVLVCFFSLPFTCLRSHFGFDSKLVAWETVDEMWRTHESHWGTKKKKNVEVPRYFKWKNFNYNLHLMHKYIKYSWLSCHTHPDVSAWTENGELISILSQISVCVGVFRFVLLTNWKQNGSPIKSFYEFYKANQSHSIKTIEKVFFTWKMLWLI